MFASLIKAAMSVTKSFRGEKKKSVKNITVFSLENRCNFGIYNQKR
jgi:hypothetical protein